MIQKNFLQPRLSGPSFEDGSIPLNILAGIAGLGELIENVAKWRFLEAHPSRKQIPRNFTDGIELKLSGLEAGSAISRIDLITRSSQHQDSRSELLPHVSELRVPDNETQYLAYYDEALATVMRFVDLVKNDEPREKHLPRKYWKYFYQIGHNLQDQDVIEIRSHLPIDPVELDRNALVKLKPKREDSTQHSEALTVRGLIPEVDQSKKSFQIKVLGGRSVRAEIPDQYFDVIMQAFNHYDRSSTVSISGFGRYDSNNRLAGLQSIERIVLFDPLDINARLDELRELKDGWLDGEGYAPSDAGLTWLSASFNRYYPEGLIRPRLYPTFDGGVQAEWVIKSTDVSININLLSREGEWHSLDLVSDTERQRILSLDDENAWKWIVKEIQILSGKPK